MGARNLYVLRAGPQGAAAAPFPSAIACCASSLAAAAVLPVPMELVDDLRDAYGFDMAGCGVGALESRRAAELSEDAAARRWDEKWADGLMGKAMRAGNGTKRVGVRKRVSRLLSGRPADGSAIARSVSAPAPAVHEGNGHRDAGAGDAGAGGANNRAPTPVPPPVISKDGRPSGALKALIRRGIPVRLRPLLWPALARLQGGVQHDEEYLREVSRTLAKGDANATQIEMDLARTFPGNTSLRIVHTDDDGDGDGDGDERPGLSGGASSSDHDSVPTTPVVPTPARGSSAHKAALRLMLRAYAATHPGIGYCQGMNYVAAFLLLVIGPERVVDAYTVFAFLLDHVLYPQTYDANLSGAHVSLKTLGALIVKKLPRLHAHMEAHFCSDPSLFATDWFLTLMCKNLPAETAARVWDCILSEGVKVMYRASLAMLKMFETRMLKGTHAGEVLQSLSRGVKELHDREGLITTMFHGIGSLPMRAVYRAQIDSAAAVEQELAQRYGLQTSGQRNV